MNPVINFQTGQGIVHVLFPLDSTFLLLGCFKQNTKSSLPYFTSSVCAGFPSPADDYLEMPLDLNEHLISHPAATYFVRAKGESMKDLGINDQDLLIVDRSIEARSGMIVIVMLDGEFTVKTLKISSDKKVFLQPANLRYPTIEIQPEQDFVIFGVVTYVIHSMKDIGN